MKGALALCLLALAAPARADDAPAPKKPGDVDGANDDGANDDGANDDGANDDGANDDGANDSANDTDARASSAMPPSPPPVRLQLTRGDGADHCPDDEMLRDAVAARLGYLPFDRGASRVLAVTLGREGEVLRATVRLVDGDDVVGERVLDSAENDCTELSRAVVLAMAIAIDPLSLSRPPPPPVEPAPPPAPEIVEVVRPGPPQKPEVIVKEVVKEKVIVRDQPPVYLIDTENVPDGPWPKVFGTLGGMTLFETGPGPVALAPSLGVGLRLHPAFSIAYEGRAESASKGPREDIAALGSVTTQLATGSLVPCFHSGWLSGCALGTGGVLTGVHDAVGLGDAPFAAPYLALGGRAALEIPFWHLFVRVHMDLSFHLVRAQLRDTLAGEVGDTRGVMYTLPPLAGGVGLALGGQLP